MLIISVFYSEKMINYNFYDNFLTQIKIHKKRNLIIAKLSLKHFI